MEDGGLYLQVPYVDEGLNRAEEEKEEYCSLAVIYVTNLNRNGRRHIP